VDERVAALNGVIDEGVDASSLLVGTSACALPDAVRLTEHAVRSGTAGQLVFPPFHFATVSDDGVFATYDRLIQDVGDDRMRLFFYHHPNLTSVDVSFPVIQRLLDAHGDIIAGVKDSSREWDHMQALCRSFPDMRVFAGTERYLAPILGSGGAGCISATANLTAPLARRVYDTVKDGGEADELQAELSNLRMDIAQHPMIAAVKALLSMQTGDETWTRARPPILPANENVRRALTGMLERL
jgi:4-hydroxy-tetrahydrodipicolinate synthase